MALDGVFINALTKEFNEKFTGLRIDKRYQPEHDELLLLLHGKSGSFKLCLSANASIARAYIEEDEKSSKSEPPVFCMLLRKHLLGGKIIRVFQPDFERVIKFYVEGYNEFGDLTEKILILEIMGRHSNIILADENGKVISTKVDKDGDGTADKVVNSLRPPLIFFRKGAFISQLKVWNKNRILNALNLLYQTERECKTSDLPSEQIASFAIIRIANGVKRFR